MVHFKIALISSERFTGSWVDWEVWGRYVSALYRKVWAAERLVKMGITTGNTTVSKWAWTVDWIYWTISWNCNILRSLAWRSTFVTERNWPRSRKLAQLCEDEAVGLESRSIVICGLFFPFSVIAFDSVVSLYAWNLEGYALFLSHSRYIDT